MYCPECGGEYREGFYQCADCGVALVETAPVQPEPAPLRDLVTVLEVRDPGVLAIAESLLLEAGIPYLKNGDALQDLLSGRMGLGYSVATGPVQVQVAEEHAEVAAQLLAEPTQGPLEEEGGQPAGDHPTQE